jgi:hypothetical protein
MITVTPPPPLLVIQRGTSLERTYDLSDFRPEESC